MCDCNRKSCGVPVDIDSVDRVPHRSPDGCEGQEVHAAAEADGR